jgi:hypothetical protein
MRRRARRESNMADAVSRHVSKSLRTAERAGARRTQNFHRFWLAIELRRTDLGGLDTPARHARMYSAECHFWGRTAR